MVISYQIFTQTAVHSIATSLAEIWPSMGEVLLPNLHLIVFIHAFAWIFVLSSVIPSIILGKRSILLQFLLVLTLTLIAVFLENILANQVQGLFVWFQNPLIAGAYLSAPYLFMLYLDLHSRKTQTRKSVQETMTEYLGESAPTGGTPTRTRNAHMPEKAHLKNKLNFLHGVSAVCFLLAFFTLLIGSTFLNTLLILVYVTFLVTLGAILMRIGSILPTSKRMVAVNVEDEQQHFE
jgi:hypothetical protein